MPQQVSEPPRRALWGAWRLRPGVVTLALGLALVVTGCGSATIGAQPTATPRATATPTPCSTWGIVSSPNAPDFKSNVLSGVSALSPTDAWAVGTSRNVALTGGPQGQQTLIERWDGTAWRIVTSPSADSLHDVAALSPSDVWAVGGELNYGVGFHPYTPLIEHWNGAQWAVTPTPDTHANAVELDAVAAIAANDVWAVGFMDSGAQHHFMPLIEHWDGAAWSIVASPIPSGSTDTRLSAIAAIPGTKQLWALGSRTGASSAYAQALIERWDGTSWQIVQSPTLPSGALGEGLDGVMALSATDAWAVGSYTASNHTIRTLIAHWDGATWQVVTTPDTWGTLSAVAAVGAHNVRAVGHTFSGDGNTQGALIEQWDGAAWQVITNLISSSVHSSGLSDVAADSAGSYWAVGSSGDTEGNVQTLVARCS